MPTILKINVNLNVWIGAIFLPKFFFFFFTRQHREHLMTSANHLKF